MRLLALISLALLAGCASLGNPGDGAGGFLADTLSWNGNPNMPGGDAPNMERVRGQPSDAAPLLPEAGNIWPGPLPPSKTLADLQHEAATPLETGPGMAGVTAPAPLPARLLPQRRGRVLQTSEGPATTSIGTNGVETYILPNGKQGLVMPNPDGSVTLIGADGQTLHVPKPKN